MPGWEPCECKRYNEILTNNAQLIKDHQKNAKEKMVAKKVDEARKHLQQIKTLKNSAWRLALQGCSELRKKKGGRRRRRRRTRRRTRRRRRRKRGGTRRSMKSKERQKRERRAKLLQKRLGKAKPAPAAKFPPGQPPPFPPPPRLVPAAPGAPRQSGLAVPGGWGAPAAAARAAAAADADLAAVFSNFQIGPGSPGLSKSMKKMSLKQKGSIKKKGGRRRTRRRH